MIVTNQKNVKSTIMEVKEKDMPKVLKSIETKGESKNEIYKY